jgi:hypothetical protein
MKTLLDFCLPSAFYVIIHLWIKALKQRGREGGFFFVIKFERGV